MIEEFAVPPWVRLMARMTGRHLRRATGWPRRHAEVAEVAAAAAAAIPNGHPCVGRSPPDIAGKPTSAGQPIALAEVGVASDPPSPADVPVEGRLTQSLLEAARVMDARTRSLVAATLPADSPAASLPGDEPATAPQQATSAVTDDESPAADGPPSDRLVSENLPLAHFEEGTSSLVPAAEVEPLAASGEISAEPSAVPEPRTEIPAAEPKPAVAAEAGGWVVATLASTVPVGLVGPATSSGSGEAERSPDDEPAVEALAGDGVGDAERTPRAAAAAIVSQVEPMPVRVAPDAPGLAGSADLAEVCDIDADGSAEADRAPAVEGTTPADGAAEPAAGGPNEPAAVEQVEAAATEGAEPTVSSDVRSAAGVEPGGATTTDESPAELAVVGTAAEASPLSEAEPASVAELASPSASDAAPDSVSAGLAVGAVPEAIGLSADADRPAADPSVAAAPAAVTLPGEHDDIDPHGDASRASADATIPLPDPPPAELAADDAVIVAEAAVAEPASAEPAVVDAAAVGSPSAARPSADEVASAPAAQAEASVLTAEASPPPSPVPAPPPVEAPPTAAATAAQRNAASVLAPAVRDEFNRTNLDYRRPMPRPKVRGRVIDFHCHLFALRHAADWFEAADHYGMDVFLTMSPLEEATGLAREWGHRLRFNAVPSWGDTSSQWVSNWLLRIEAFYNLGSRIAKFHASPGTMAMRGLQLDAPQYEPIFAELKARKMAIMTHIGDPDTWYNGRYDPAKFGTRDEHYRMWEGLLEEHRGTPWVGAHLGGNPEDLPRLQRLLDRFPDLMLDCSATRWMVREVSARRDAAREFFIRNQDRILFGSDQVSGHDRHFDFLASRIWCHRKLWETAYTGPSPIIDPDVPKDDQPVVRGLALPDVVLQKIYHDNATRLLDKLGMGFDG